MHRDHDKIKKLLAGHTITVVRTSAAALELTLSSTHPKVTLTIEDGSFRLKAFEDDTVKPTAEYWFSYLADYGPPEPPGPRDDAAPAMAHELVTRHRRSFAERCFWKWHERSRSQEAHSELFTTQCRCGAVGEIQFHPMIHGQIKVMIWFPKDQVKKDGKACPAVLAAIAEELPAASEADVQERPAEEEQKLAQEYAVEFHRRHGEAS